MMARPTERPRVGFAMRAHLARTETFVNNQFVGLERYHPIVLAHQRRPSTDVPLTDGAVARELLPRPLEAVDRGLYRVARTPLPAGVAALARYARERDTRLLHFHFLTDLRFLVGLQRRLRLPSVVSAYGYDVSLFPRFAGGLGLRYLQQAYDHVDMFLAMTEEMRRDLIALGAPEQKVRVHYHGSDTNRFRWPERSYEPARPLNVLCCGRLDEGKGQHLLLAALRLAEARGSGDFRITIVGEGPQRPLLEAMVRESGWESRVTFTGHIRHASDELVGHYRDADIFALPSISVGGSKEGMPGTIVEAMAAGLPVLATRHGGIPMAITDLENGLLVPERDVPALADALERLLGDAALRRRLGEAAARRATVELDLQVRTRALERIYDELLALPPRG